MPAELVKFEPKSDPREVIKKLAELLDRATAGELESFVAVCMRPGGSFFSCSSGYKSSIELIGALECAQHDLIVASER